MKNLVFLSLFVFLTLQGCGGGQSSNPPTSGSTSFDDGTSKVAQAKEVLGKYPTGAKILAELNGQNPYNEPIGFIFVPGHKVRPDAEQAGGIKLGSDGKYKIVLSADLTPSNIAQAMAHELQHVKTEIDEDAYLKVNPDINARMGAVDAAIKAQTLSQANKSDTDSFFKLLMYTEVRAYEVNLTLDQEGLPFNNTAVKQMGVGPYVVQYYLQKNGYTLTDDVDGLVSKINNYSSMVEFQKSLNPQVFSTPN